VAEAVHPYRDGVGYIMSLTDKIALCTLIVTVIGVVLALAGIAVAIWTLKESARVAKAQFFVTIRALLANYDDIHAYLRPEGKWGTVPIAGPADAIEWARVELYMGTFEYCEIMLRHGFLDEKEFCKAYGYRLGNIVANPIIVEQKLIERGEYWGDFCKICKRCGVRLPAAACASKSSAAGPR
jgi:hypothetical protein